MVNQGKTTTQLNQVTGPYDTNDRLVLVYGADTANTSNSVAQTATITVQNLFGNTQGLTVIAANLQVSTQQSDPTHSNSLPTIQQGTMFFSNTFGYVAVANGVLARFNISTSF